MKKKIAIVGGGTAGLFLASFLDVNLFDITIYEKKGTLGRKFLVAGDGGFNLSHAEEMSRFVERYTPVDFLHSSLLAFTNQDLQAWLSTIGIETFVGSSQRIFPVKGIKPIQVLDAILAHLTARGVKLVVNYTFTGWDVNGDLVFNKNEIVRTDFNVFALGGASWAKTGSDGSWLDIFTSKGIDTIPFTAQNCAFGIDWSADFIKSHAGKPLKNIALSFEDQIQKGELVVTEFGLEGNAIYALSPNIQQALAIQGSATIYLDLKPTWTVEVVLKKLENAKQKISSILKQDIKLSTASIALLKQSLSKEEFLNLPILSQSIKKLPIVLTGAAPIDEAISTSGGIALSAVNTNFELLQIKNNFCIGEMLDWSAPTGGYLVHGCAAMGVKLARNLKARGSGYDDG